MNREEIINEAKQFGNISTDFPWQKFPTYQVLRHEESNKWFGLMMTITPDKLNLESMNEKIEVLNVKLDPEHVEELIDNQKYFPAYHMSKTHWLTIRLDSADDAIVIDLLKQSYELTKK